ncbi:hypothetical protein DVR12_26920 [Chitinophaga silvatica]|uniref:Uncharacterized protein n=1 Tax=Chitinophaga silvatica TaxID=2282649 RepID=A0A3E1Y1Z1_9BACT|nr:hypothetical protein [Chitinophaga silvatica]RFS18681.1 hypothetical protein DVR12_26920 [Chitinophaga silvatica]
MRNIYRLVVSTYGEAESIKVNGKLAFINCPFKRSLKIYSYPKWKFRKGKFAKVLNKYNITCIGWLEYSLPNILFNLLLRNLEKADCICFGFAGLDYSTIEKAKRLLLQLEPSINDKLILILVEEKSIDEKGLLAGFPIYENI